MKISNRTITILLCIFLLNACGGQEAPQVEAPPQISTIEIESNYTGVPIRLADDYHRRQMHNVPAPYAVQLELCQPISKGVRMEMREGVLHVKKPNAEAVIGWSLPIETAQFNTLRVKMRVEGNGDCAFLWNSNRVGEEVFRESEGVFLSDTTQMQVYNFNLATMPLFTASGVLRKFALRLGPRIKNAYIESLEFIYTPPLLPEHQLLGTEDHEVLPPLRYEWNIVPPEKAQFSAYAGMGSAQEDTAQGDGVLFTIRLLDGETGNILGHVERHLSPTTKNREHWEELRMDLSPYSGHKIKLLFETTAGSDSLGDFAYWGSPTVWQAQDAKENVPIILISLDTLRRDHLGVYGYEKNTSPNLDNFARDALVFEDAITPTTWTLPSHVSMFTGLGPLKHKVSINVNLDYSISTLPQLLRTTGYLTFGVTGHGWWLKGERCFSRGMDFYDTPEDFRYFDESVDIATGWLDARATDKFFVFLHSYDMHSKSPTLGLAEPYHPGKEGFMYFSKGLKTPTIFQHANKADARGTEFLIQLNAHNQKLDTATQEYVVALYDDAIRFTDTQLSRFFDYLKQRDLYDKATILVTADHGESFGEHGVYGHEQVYDECARVPMILKLPHNQRAGERIHGQLSLNDVFPTLLTRAGVTVPMGIDGLDMVDNLPAQEYAHVMRLGKVAVRTPEYKYIEDRVAGGLAFYSLAHDPSELDNVTGSLPEVESKLAKELSEHFVRDESGWNMLIYGNKNAQNLSLQIKIDDGIASYEFRNAEDMRNELSSDTAKLTLDRRQMETHFGVTPADMDMILVRPFKNNGVCQMAITCSSDFELQVGDGSKKSGQTFTIDLNPEDPALRKPALLPTGANQNLLLVIWYEPVLEGQTPAPTMSEEVEEQLKGLGYLGGE